LVFFRAEKIGTNHSQRGGKGTGTNSVKTNKKKMDLREPKEKKKP